MPQSLSSILIHLIFSTKNREPFISAAIEKELHPYLATIFRSLKSPSLTIDGTTDHVHILFSFSRVIKIADLVEEVKTDSSKWIKTKGLEFKNFHWQRLWCFFDWTIAGPDPKALYCPSKSSSSTRYVSG
jgi:putative transposase